MSTTIDSTNNNENKPQSIGEKAIEYRDEKEAEYYAAKMQKHSASKKLYAFFSRLKSAKNSGNQGLIAQTQGAYKNYKNSVYSDLESTTSIKLSSWRDSVFSAAKLSQC